MLTFAQLVAPMAVTEFFSTHWEQRHLHVRRDLPGFYDSVVSVMDLDRHLQSRQLPAAFLNVVRQGAKVPLPQWTCTDEGPSGDTARVAIPERLLALHGDGATLIFNRAHRALPALADFCGALSRDLGIHARANLYLSPPRSRGLAAHYDLHEVCVLQVHGRKTWRLYQRAVDCPVEAPEGTSCSSKPGDLVQEMELCPGDLLYLPRGLVHEAATQADSSLHIALGLQPTYGFHWLETLVGQARKERGFRSAVSRGNHANDAVVASQMATWLAATDWAELSRQQHRGVLAAEPPSLRGRLRDLLQAEHVTGDTLVARREDVAFTVTPAGDELMVGLPDRQLHLPRLLAPALDRFGQPGEFTPASLAGLLTPAHKVELVANFVRAGLLTIVKH